MRICAAILFVSSVLNSSLSAYEIDGSKWAGGETVFHTDLDGLSNTLVPWNEAVLSALEEWNNQTDFNFVVREEYRHPCVNDLINSIDFTGDVCGSSFGANTIAVTLRDFEASVLGPPDILSADIVINQSKVFDVFDGPLSPFHLGTVSNPIDLRRVVLHELGHVIGLGHDDQVDAIMNSTIGDIDRLQQDDIDGANTLYGGLGNCQVESVYFGSSSGTLQNGDCTVQDLMVGGDDLSFIDIRRLVLTEPADLTIEMYSASLDSVVMLADEKLRILDLDDNSGPNCDARLDLNLSAGTYFVLSNTYDESSTCADIVGPYRLDLTFNAVNQPDLQAGSSLLGSQADAVFFGGITADHGASYGNRFSPDQALDVSGRILIDPRHVGEAGFIVVGALLDGRILLKNQLDQWVEFDLAEDPLIKATEKTLEEIEEITLVEGLVTGDLGYQQVTVDFYIGYGLDAEPDELYFHQYPINLLVEP